MVDATRALSRRDHLNLELIVPQPADFDEQMRVAREAINDGVDAVVVHGGDGAVQIGFNLVAGTGVPLGVVPAGTGNDFARAAGIDRKDPIRALEDILAAIEGKILATEIDAIRLSITGDRTEERWVANSVNIGFDARVNQVANAMKHVPGSLRYAVALAQEVPRFDALDVTMRLDDGPDTSMVTPLVCVQNGPYIGGGIPLAPGSTHDDGVMDVSYVTTASKTALVSLFPLVMARMNWAVRPLVRKQVRSVSVAIDAGVPVFADGDEVLDGSQGPVRVTVSLERGAVRLLQTEKRQHIPQERFGGA